MREGVNALTEALDSKCAVAMDWAVVDMYEMMSSLMSVSLATKSLQAYSS